MNEHLSNIRLFAPKCLANIQFSMVNIERIWLLLYIHDLFEYFSGHYPLRKSYFKRVKGLSRIIFFTLSERIFSNSAHANQQV